MNRSKQLSRLLYVLYIILFVSMVCCFRAVSSIAIGLILVAGMFKNKVDTGSWLGPSVRNLFFATCCLFYLIQVTAFLYTANFNESLKHLQTQSAIFFVPLALCSCNYLKVQVREKLMKSYIWVLAVALFYCMVTALYKYCFMHAQNDIFFYHELVSPFKQHAVQVSIYCFVGLLYLLDRLQKGYRFVNKCIHFLLILYFICCLLLLSSKLVIVFSACSLLYYFFLILKAKLNRSYMLLASLFAGLVMIVLVLLTQNRVSQRFNEILSGDLHLVEQQNFNPGIYFNGLQFRLLQWRFVKEILTEHHAWVTGVSDEAQTLLDEKYISTHMYTGGVNSATRGYLGYNTHDQFLQALLQTGIPGLVSFILICCAMVSLAIQRQNRELAITVFLLIAYCFNESLLETQYGVMLFTFFPLFTYYGSEE